MTCGAQWTLLFGTCELISSHSGNHREGTFVWTDGPVTDYATLRAEARENAEDNRVREFEAHRDDYDRCDDGPYHVAAGMEMEPR